MEREILKYSNPTKVFQKARSYLGNNVVIKLSSNPNKKYMILIPNTNRWVHFGQMGYEDFTKHNDPIRRKRYLTRTANIKGDWETNKYSPNNLSRHFTYLFSRYIK